MNALEIEIAEILIKHIKQQEEEFNPFFKSLTINGEKIPYALYGQPSLKVRTLVAFARSIVGKYK